MMPQYTPLYGGHGLGNLKRLFLQRAISSLLEAVFILIVANTFTYVHSHSR